MNFFLFLQKQNFQSCFDFTAKVCVKGKEISHTLPMSKYAYSLIISIPHQSGTLVKMDEPILTHRIDSLHQGLLYGFGQKLDVMYPSLQYHAEQFQCLKKKFYAPPSHLSHCTTPGNYCSFCCLHNFTFSKISYSWNYTVVQPFQIGFFLIFKIFIQAWRLIS